MASAVASKGTPLAGLEKLLAEPSGAPGVAYYARHPMTAAAAHRLFNLGGLPLVRYDKEEEEESSDSEDDVPVNDHRRKREFTSADLVGPFGKMLSKLEDAVRAERGSLAAPRRGWWVAKQDDDAVTLKVLMPGLGKEHVKVRADRNALVIKGEGHKETADDKEEQLRYSHRIELPADAFKMDQVRAEMMNGLLKVTVPRVKDEEHKDVFHVTIE